MRFHLDLVASENRRFRLTIKKRPADLGVEIDLPSKVIMIDPDCRIKTLSNALRIIEEKAVKASSARCDQ